MDSSNMETSISSSGTFVITDEKTGESGLTPITPNEMHKIFDEDAAELKESSCRNQGSGIGIPDPKCQEHLKQDEDGDYDEISPNVYVNSHVESPTDCLPSKDIKNAHNDYKHMTAESKDEKKIQNAKVKKFKNVNVSKKQNARHGKNEEHEPISRSAHFKQKSKVLFKKFLVFLFSHVGLTCLVVAYSIFGAIIFQSLEQGHERESRMVTAKLRHDMLTNLWNVTKAFNVLIEEKWTISAEKILRNFEQDIYVATKELGWDGISDEAVSELHWSFTGSLLYSVTVITTIGYGHITPKTSWGRIVTIIYAFFGIPLTLLCLANIGALMGKGFQMLYNRIPVIRSRQHYGLRSALPLPQTVIHTEKNQNEDGSITEEKNVLVYIPSRQLPPPADVPIIVCSLLVVFYTLVGTVIFLLWETSWDVLTSAYFCFITLSTIGFGDVVPGHSLDSWQSQPKQFLCTIYLLFGLTLLAMCFDLLQDQVRSMATRFGEFLGIIDEEEGEEYVEEEIVDDRKDIDSKFKMNGDNHSYCEEHRYEDPSSEKKKGVMKA